jgi:pectate lyase
MNRFLKATLSSLGFTLPALLFAASSAQAAGPVSGAIVTLKGVQSGNCLGVKGSSSASGATLQSQGCSASDFQRWKAVSDGAGYYQLVNVGSGLCIDVPGASAAGGAVMQQWGCAGGNWQKWAFNDDGSGHYYLTSKSSGLSLDVLNQNTANGAAVVQWKYWGGANQQWATATTPAADTAPVGFGAGTTGGIGGAVVTVTTPAQLAYELCRTSSGGVCTDTTPRIIQVSGAIDFRGSEGPVTSSGCYVKQCSAGPSEYILGSLGACNGKSSFNITYDKAGGTPLLVGSNKSVIGLGSTAAIRGKGLKLVGGVSNIIIRNLTISDINAQVVWGGDGITMDNVDRVWIDHNRFALIGRQMIVSGWNKASHVSVTWNEFDGRTPYSATCDGTHYWVALMIGANDSITMANNWVHHFGGRAPHVGTDSGAMQLHMYNNYFQHAPNGHSLDAGSDTTYVLVEGNYYEDVARPLTPVVTAHVMAPLTSTAAGAASACNAALKRACVGNVADPMPSNGTSAFPADATALRKFGGLSTSTLPTPYPAANVPTVVPASAGPGHL